MKVQFEIEINAPVERLWSIFDGDPEYIATHPDITSFVATNGKHGQEGTVAHLVTSDGSFEMESTCTVLERNAPHAIQYMFQSNVSTYMLNCRIEPRANGFLYINEAKLVFHGLYKLVMPIFGPLICNRMYDNMRFIKEYLEGRSAQALPEAPPISVERNA